MTVSNANIVLENVLVSVNLTHEQASDAIIKLISPSGTESILMNRPGWS
ncbi:proprotein convertase P-domain-containing protein [Avibacterium paragallinarum]|nr:proprotein convertase P-domain-containing protein [Avibacterium paragallinarum]